MKECIFCSIANDTKQSEHMIYATDVVCAFLDIFPITRGHTLVIPREHYERYADIPDTVIAELAKALKKLGSAITSAVGADAHNFGMNNGSAAGQIVPHAHWHIIPRMKNDGLSNWENRDVTKEELDEVALEIRNYLHTK